MALYTPTVGIITNIDAAQRNYSIFFDLQSEDHDHSCSIPARAIPEQMVVFPTM